MAKDLVLDVIARKNSKDLQTLAAEFDKLATEAEASGKKINKTFSGSIDDQIKGTKKELQSLRAEFAKTGDLKVAGDIGGLERNLKSLEKIKSTFGTAGEDAGLSLMQGVAYGAAAAAPIVLPAVGGLILAGLGLGVIGAGIVGQLGSPQVKQALAGFKADAGSVFSDVTAPFGGVLTRELSAADDLLHKVSPQLTEMFTKAAPAADHLFAGINGLVEKSLPGLNKGLDGANVVVDELGRDLPAVGKAIGDAFAAAAVGAQGDAHALHDLLTVVDQLIVGAGGLAGESGVLYEQLRSIATLNFSAPELSSQNLQKSFNAATTLGIEPLIEHLFGLDKKNKDVKQSTDDFAKALNDYRDKADQAARMTQTMAAAVLDFDQKATNAKLDTLSFKDGLQSLTDTLKNGKGAFNDNSDAGRQAEEQYLRLAQQAQQTSQKVLDNGGTVTQAAKTYIDLKTQLDNAARSAGATQKDIDALNASLDNTVKVRKGSIDIEVNITGNGKALVTNQGTSLLAGKGVKFFASGGQYQAGVPRVVGENGPEFDIPDHSGRIIPKIPAATPYVTSSATRGASRGGSEYMLQASPAADSLTAQFLHALVDHGVLQLVRR